MLYQLCLIGSKLLNSNSNTNIIIYPISAGPGGASALSRFRDRAANGTDKPISPFLRAKSNPEEPESKTNSSDTAVDSANDHTDAATKLSFKEDETKVESDDKVINGSIEDKSQKKVGHYFRFDYSKVPKLPTIRTVRTLGYLSNLLEI